MYTWLVTNRNCFYANKHFCPFQLTQEYIEIRGDYLTDKEPFLIFRNRSPVTPSHAGVLLKQF